MKLLTEHEDNLFDFMGATKCTICAEKHGWVIQILHEVHFIALFCVYLKYFLFLMQIV
jgi:hypothetical protein